MIGRQRSGPEAMDRRALLGCGCAALADAGFAAPSPAPVRYLPLKTVVEIPLSTLGETWAPVPFKARFTRSDGADSVVPAIAVRMPQGLEAFCAYCPHELCVLGLNETHQLRCPCHFSLFDPRRDGAWIFGPAPRGAYRLEHSVSGRALVVTGIEADLERRLL